MPLKLVRPDQRKFPVDVVAVFESMQMLIEVLGICSWNVGEAITWPWKTGLPQKPEVNTSKSGLPISSAIGLKILSIRSSKEVCLLY